MNNFSISKKYSRLESFTFEQDLVGKTMKFKKYMYSNTPHFKRQ